MSAELWERELRDIKFSVRRESGEAFVVGEDEPIEVDLLRAHVPDPDVPKMVVVVGGDL